jgi:hypothetical protein
MCAQRSTSTAKPRFRRMRKLLGYLSRRQLLTCIAASAFLWGSGDGSHLLGATRRPKAWFDAKGAFVFPLGAGALPITRDELTASFTQGWKAHLRIPETSEVVQTSGGRFPAIGNLNIHLTGASSDINRDRTKNPPLKPSGKVEGRVTVRHFDLDARPMLTDKAKLNIHVAATDARLDIEHDEKGRPMAMLGDAKTAMFQFAATRSDLEHILTIDLDEAARKYGVSVKKVSLQLDAVNDRSIDVDVHISTTVAFIPAGMRFRAHVDIDGEMYAKLSKLQCDGDEALGFLIVGLIKPGLAKYEGKSRLVFAFPTGQLKLKDVKVQGGDDVTISAEFAR